MTHSATAPAAVGRRIVLLITAASVIGAVSLGIRSSFGIFLQPISADFGWGREVFAISIALSNFLWGVAQPFAGMLADRFGSGRVLVAGALTYAAGTALMAWSSTPSDAHLTIGVLVGLGSAGCGLWIVYAAAARVVPPERCTLALGIISAAASFGQFAMVPIGQAFLDTYGWQTAFVLLGIVALVMVPMAGAVTGRAVTPTVSPRRFRSAMAEAARHRGYLLLNAGFFVCGFQVIFIVTHLPAYVTDSGLPAEVGAWTLALIGLVNIFGSIVSGVLGGRFSKKGILTLLYFSRAVVIAVFVLSPASIASTLSFGVAIGVFWFGTVPLTTALVAQIFGPQYLGTLSGIVLLSHQTGALLGAWLGGRLFDVTGSYDITWWIAVALGLVAAALHYPIDERPLGRTAPA
ncbi:MAG: MFS transporter [Rhodospirillaceae bacterium]|nr:MFS transporter [Rhodospirillaceae bacterium]